MADKNIFDIYGGLDTRESYGNESSILSYTKAKNIDIDGKVVRRARGQTQVSIAPSGSTWAGIAPAPGGFIGGINEDGKYYRTDPVTLISTPVYSGIINMPLVTPTNLSGIYDENSGTINLTWTNENGTDVDIEIWLKIDSGEYALIETGLSNWLGGDIPTGVTHDVSALGYGTFYYKVRAVNDRGYSDYSDETNVSVTNPVDFGIDTGHNNYAFLGYDNGYIYTANGNYIYRYNINNLSEQASFYTGHGDDTGCIKGGFLYTSGGPFREYIYKYTLPNVVQVRSVYTGNLNTPIDVIGGYLYVYGAGKTIYRYAISDLSGGSIGDVAIDTIRVISDGSALYIADFDGHQAKYSLNPLRQIAFNESHSYRIATDGSYIYSASGTSVYKYDMDTLSLVSSRDTGYNIISDTFTLTSGAYICGVYRLMPNYLVLIRKSDLTFSKLVKVFSDTYGITQCRSLGADRVFVTTNINGFNTRGAKVVYLGD